MSAISAFSHRFTSAICLCCVGLFVGCATPVVTNSVVAGGATLALGHTPTTNIVQTFYLGVFDPRDQLPATIYRVRVQGQASGLSWTKFASGWVQADLIDSLSGRVELERTGLKVSEGPGAGSGGKLADDKSSLNRRLVMFGPEGFREAPKNHRLVEIGRAHV